MADDLVVLIGNTCFDKECSYRKKCANHNSAGDFRSEGGATPMAILVDNNIVCDRRISSTTYGSIYIKDGRLWLYDGPYDNDQPVDVDGQEWPR